MSPGIARTAPLPSLPADAAFQRCAVDQFFCYSDERCIPQTEVCDNHQVTPVYQAV